MNRLINLFSCLLFIQLCSTQFYYHRDPSSLSEWMRKKFNLPDDGDDYYEGNVQIPCEYDQNFEEQSHPELNVDTFQEIVDHFDTPHHEEYTDEDPLRHFEWNFRYPIEHKHEYSKISLKEQSTKNTGAYKQSVDKKSNVQNFNEQELSKKFLIDNFHRKRIKYQPEKTEQIDNHDKNSSVSQHPLLNFVDNIKETLTNHKDSLVSSIQSNIHNLTDIFNKTVAWSEKNDYVHNLLNITKNSTISAKPETPDVVSNIQITSEVTKIPQSMINENINILNQFTHNPVDVHLATPSLFSEVISKVRNISQRIHALKNKNESYLSNLDHNTPQDIETFEKEKNLSENDVLYANKNFKQFANEEINSSYEENETTNNDQIDVIDTSPIKINGTLLDFSLIPNNTLSYDPTNGSTQSPDSTQQENFDLKSDDYYKSINVSKTVDDNEFTKSENENTIEEFINEVKLTIPEIKDDSIDKSTDNNGSYKGLEDISGAKQILENNEQDVTQNLAVDGKTVPLDEKGYSDNITDRDINSNDKNVSENNVNESVVFDGKYVTIVRNPQTSVYIDRTTMPDINMETKINNNNSLDSVVPINTKSIESKSELPGKETNVLEETKYQFVTEKIDNLIEGKENGINIERKDDEIPETTKEVITQEVDVERKNNIESVSENPNFENTRTTFISDFDEIKSTNDAFNEIFDKNSSEYEDGKDEEIFESKMEISTENSFMESTISTNNSSVEKADIEKDLVLANTSNRDAMKTNTEETNEVVDEVQSTLSTEEVLDVSKEINADQKSDAKKVLEEKLQIPVDINLKSMPKEMDTIQSIESDNNNDTSMQEEIKEGVNDSKIDLKLLLPEENITDKIDIDQPEEKVGELVFNDNALLNASVLSGFDVVTEKSLSNKVYNEDGKDITIDEKKEELDNNSTDSDTVDETNKYSLLQDTVKDDSESKTYDELEEILNPINDFINRNDTENFDAVSDNIDEETKTIYNESIAINDAKSEILVNYNNNQTDNSIKNIEKIMIGTNDSLLENSSNKNDENSFIRSNDSIVWDYDLVIDNEKTDSDKLDVEDDRKSRKIVNKRLNYNFINNNLEHFDNIEDEGFIKYVSVTENPNRSDIPIEDEDLWTELGSGEVDYGEIKT